MLTLELIIVLLIPQVGNKLRVMKYKVVTENEMLYMVMCKKAWYTRWKYVRSKNNPALINVWNSKKLAQAYINFLPKKYKL
jgi:hypothetical protein